MPKPKTTRELFEEYQVSVYCPKNQKAPKRFRYQWYDPKWGRRRYKRTRHIRKRDAEQEAADHIRAIDDGTYTDAIGWFEFCQAYEGEKADRHSHSNAEAWRTTKRWIWEYFVPQPRFLQDVADSKRILRWQNRLRDERRLSEASIACYSARLKTALKFALDMEWIGKMPKIHIPAIRSRGGYVSPGDLELMVKVARAARPGNYRFIQLFMRALYWSGFRLNELRILSWDRGSVCWLDAEGVDGMPVVRVTPSGQKARRDDVRGILPEFWELACESAVRTGYVFPLPNGQGGQLTRKTIGKIIGRIGRQAGVLVDVETGKTATAHDLRKSFVVNLHQLKKLSTAEAQKWVGHRDIRTTTKHYFPVTGVQLAARFWGKGHEHD